MKHHYLFALLSACFVGIAQADNIRRAHLHSLKVHPLVEERIMLDSIKGDTYRKFYTYNNQGYITSVKVFDNNNGEWNLDTSESFEQDFTFNANGRCTKRIVYALNELGERADTTEKVVLEVDDKYTWEKYYNYQNPNAPYLSDAIAYDRWGNLTIEDGYTYNPSTKKSKHTSRTEERYTGKVPRANHCNYDKIKQNLRIYNSTVTPNGTKYDFSALKVECKVIGGKYIRTQSYLNTTVARPSTVPGARWTTFQTETFNLNDDQTRPTSNADGSRTWEWDALGRPTAIVNEGETTKYTYKDNDAPDYTIDELIQPDVPFYPEESFLRYGRPHSMESITEGKKEIMVFTYGDNLLPESAILTDNMVEGGKITFTYNEEGHLATMVLTTDEYETVTTYVYDKYGTWTDVDEEMHWFEAEDANQSPTRSRLLSRLAKPSFKVAKPTDGLVDASQPNGIYPIKSSDGVWQYEGQYSVYDHIVESGYYSQYLVSNASVPSNPEYNYTDPIAPLEYDDETDMAVEERAAWNFRWIYEKMNWELQRSPDYAYRTYTDGNNIRRDRYNANQEVDSYNVYVLDEQQRLTENQFHSGNTRQTDSYVYFPETDYIETHTLSTQIEGSPEQTETRHYYYSKHSYTDTTTDIESVGINKPAIHNHTLYNLQGQPVKTPHRGIYIQGNKKIFVR